MLLRCVILMSYSMTLLSTKLFWKCYELFFFQDKVSALFPSVLNLSFVLMDVTVMMYVTFLILISVVILS